MPGGKNNVILGQLLEKLEASVDIAELGVNVIVTVAAPANARSALAMVIENCDTRDPDL